MIKNERQYRITNAQAEKLSQTLHQLRQSSAAPAGVHPLLVKAQEDGLQSQLDELRAELMEYETLRSGRRSVLQPDSFTELPRALI